MGKERVHFIGFQEMGESEPSIALVNETSGSTVRFKPDEHKIINIDDWLKERPQKPYDDLRAQEIRNRADKIIHPLFLMQTEE